MRTEPSGPPALAGEPDYLHRATVVGERAAGRAEICEKMRRLPDETIADLRAYELFDMLKPAAYGGSECTPRAFFEVVSEVSRHCGSTGWVLSILGFHTWGLGSFPAAAREEVWDSGADSSRLIASSFPSRGQASRVDGGIRVNGRWPFASGADHAAWALLAVDVPGNNGAPGFQHAILVPREEFSVDDVWHAMGLKGTGSNDLVVEDALVPAHRAMPYVDLLRPRGTPDAAVAGATYRYPWGLMLAHAVSAPAIGLARHACDLFREFVVEKERNLPERSPGATDLYRLLARATTGVDSLEERRRAGFLALEDRIARDVPPPIELRARCRWELSWITESAIGVVRDIYDAMGGRAVFESSPIQRILRDISAVRAHHISDPAGTAENFGRVAAGRESRDLFL